VISTAHCAEIVAVVSMLFHEPMPNSSLNLTDKVEAALLSEVSEIADQVWSCFPLDHELFFAKPARLGD